MKWPRLTLFRASLQPMNFQLALKRVGMCCSIFAAVKLMRGLVSVKVSKPKTCNTLHKKSPTLCFVPCRHRRVGTTQCSRSRKPCALRQVPISRSAAAAVSRCTAPRVFEACCCPTKSCLPSFGAVTEFHTGPPTLHGKSNYA